MDQVRGSADLLTDDVNVSLILAHFVLFCVRQIVSIRYQLVAMSKYE